MNGAVVYYNTKQKQAINNINQCNVIVGNSSSTRITTTTTITWATWTDGHPRHPVCQNKHMHTRVC